MEQQLKKTIKGVEQAIAAFQSIRWPASSVENSVNCITKDLSDAWAAVAACKNAVNRAGISARSTGWYVDEELWGAVRSRDWHLVADLAEELEAQLDDASNSIVDVETIVRACNEDWPDAQMLASCVIADIQNGISFDGLVEAMEELSFLN